MLGDISNESQSRTKNQARRNIQLSTTPAKAYEGTHTYIGLEIVFVCVRRRALWMRSWQLCHSHDACCGYVTILFILLMACILSFRCCHLSLQLHQKHCIYDTQRCLMLSTLQWIFCTKALCSKWVHIKCDQAKHDQSKKDGTPYICPNCPVSQGREAW